MPRRRSPASSSTWPTTACPLDKTSYRLGAALAMDPKTERFTNGSKDATALLSRPARKGFTVPMNV